MRRQSSSRIKNGRETNIDREQIWQWCLKFNITEKQDDPWNGERPGQDAKKKNKQEETIITYCRISKRLAVETTSLLLFMFYYSIPSLLLIPAQKYASHMPFHITCAEMHADHIVSSGSPHNNALHFSSIILSLSLSFLHTRTHTHTHTQHVHARMHTHTHTHTCTRTHAHAHTHAHTHTHTHTHRSRRSSRRSI